MNLSYSDVEFPLDTGGLSLPFLVLLEKMPVDLEFLIRDIWNFLVHVLHDAPRRRHPTFNQKTNVSCHKVFLFSSILLTVYLAELSVRPSDGICQAKAQTSPLALCKDVISCREAADRAYMVGRLAPLVEH